MISEDVPKQQHRKQTGQPGHTFTLDLPVSFRRRGVEMKLIITDDRVRSPKPDPKLIAVVAQGRRWFAEIRDAKACSITELAKRYGIDRPNVGRAVSLSFLAPDVVEAILNGRQPTELTAARLKRVRDLPVSWAEQSQILGFTRCSSNAAIRIQSKTVVEISARRDGRRVPGEFGAGHVSPPRV